jgi:hypothetical protein
MPTGLIISAVIGGGISAFNGYEQSKSASNATKAQTDAANQSLALQQQQFQQTQANLAPYRTSGLPALATLNNIFTPGGAAAASPQANGAPLGPGTLTPGTLDPNTGRSIPAQVRSGLGPVVGQAGPRAGISSGPSMGGTLASLAGGSPSAQGGTVQMRAPDGTMEAVPLSQVAHFQSLGAQVVS